MVKQIEIGENTSLVTEILDLVDSGMLLKSSGQATGQDGTINDLEVAKKFAWEEVYGSDEFTWADLRSEKMSEIWEIIYGDDDKYSEIDKKLTGTLDEISHVIQGQLDQQHKELLDDIVSDIKACLLSRAVQGKNSEFFESIFSIYLNGSWPCGWSGDWPSGHILAYKNT